MSQQALPCTPPPKKHTLEGELIFSACVFGASNFFLYEQEDFAEDIQSYRLKIIFMSDFGKRSFLSTSAK